MDPFKTLQKQAAEKRDAIIASARAEFALAKKRIHALRVQMGAAAPEVPPLKFRRVIDVIADAIPHDHPFTVGELMELVIKIEPGRRFTQSTLRTTCQRLEKAGGIRRVGRLNGLTLWAASDYKGEVDVNVAKRLPEMAADVLKVTGPLRPADLLVRILERGYRASDNKRKVLKALTHALYRCPQFQRDKHNRWSVVK